MKEDAGEHQTLYLSPPSFPLLISWHSVYYGSERKQIKLLARYIVDNSKCFYFILRFYTIIALSCNGSMPMI